MRNAVLACLAACLLLTLSVPVPAAAQSSTLETVPLDSIVGGERDRYALAERFLGITVEWPGWLSERNYPAPRAVGERETFTVIDTRSNTSQPVPATLRAVADSAYVWLEDGLDIPQATLDGFATGFSEQLAAIHAIWMRRNIEFRDIDRDPRVYLLITDDVNAQAAYFSSDHLYPRAIVPTSSEHELLIFNAGVVATYPLPELLRVAAHEYQHLLRHLFGGSPFLWINEGFSQYTEYRLTGAAGWLTAFYAQPDVALTGWDTDPAIVGAHYGAALDWLLYLEERCGPNAVFDLSQTVFETRRLASRLNAGFSLLYQGIRHCTDVPVERFMGDWIAARAPRFATQPFTDYGSGLSAVWDTVSQLGTDVYTLTHPGGGPLTLTLATAPRVPTLPGMQLGLDVTSPFLMAEPHDLSHQPWAFDIDLTGAATAELTYRVWYALEAGYDYAYVSVDTGTYPVTIVTPVTETFDPHGLAYGPAYTGESGGWRTETVALDAFVGGRVRVWFDVITDDGLHLQGVALDDVRVAVDGGAAVAYANDFNRVTPETMRYGGWWWRWPQRFEYVVVQVIDAADGRVIDQQLRTDVSAWTVDPGGAENLLITVSGMDFVEPMRRVSYVLTALSP